LAFRLNQDELYHLVLENFATELKGKSDDNQVIIKKFIVGLAREIMHELDTRKEGYLDVS